MRIHTDVLSARDIFAAAKAARADLEITRHGSRSRTAAFNVHLTGESRRRPNRQHESHEYAATWDQWGVFLSILFDLDPELVTPYDKSRSAFHLRTHFRFESSGVIAGTEIAAAYPGLVAGAYWPVDAHGDHRFEFAGVPRSRACKSCSAVEIW